MRGAALALALLLASAPVHAGEPYRAHAGEPHRVHALTGARVVVSPGLTLGRATVVIRDGVIEAVGPGVAAPADARVWDLTGRTVYAGFLDPYLAASRLSGEARKKPE